MAKVMSEYDVESKFIDRLESIGYGYVDIKDYNKRFLLEKEQRINALIYPVDVIVVDGVSEKEDE